MEVGEPELLAFKAGQCGPICSEKNVSHEPKGPLMPTKQTNSDKLVEEPPTGYRLAGVKRR